MAPKSTNSKKESGRAKKAENENKKKEAAAVDKVCRAFLASYMKYSSTDLRLLTRNAKRQRNGLKAHEIHEVKTRRRRNDEQNLLEKLRMLVCWLQKSLLGLLK